MFWTHKTPGFYKCKYPKVVKRYVDGIFLLKLVQALFHVKCVICLLKLACKGHTHFDHFSYLLMQLNNYYSLQLTCNR